MFYIVETLSKETEDEIAVLKQANILNENNDAKL